MGKFITVSFTEGSFHELQEHSSEDKAIGYAEGFGDGAGQYGCGSAWAATEYAFFEEHIPEADWTYDDKDEFNKAIEAIAEWKKNNE